MSRWPLPGDRAVDRARQVALEYREALHRVAPQLAAQMDTYARDAGEQWVLGRSLYDDNQLVTPLQAADELGRSVRTVYNWVATGRLPRYPDVDGSIRVCMGEARAVDARRCASA